MGEGDLDMEMGAELYSLQALSCYHMGVGQWLQIHFIIIEIRFQRGQLSARRENS